MGAVPPTAPGPRERLMPQLCHLRHGHFWLHVSRFNGLTKSVCSPAITASPHRMAGCIWGQSGWREPTGCLSSPVSPCHAPGRESAWFSIFPNKQLSGAAALAAAWRAHPLQEGPTDLRVFTRGTWFRGAGNLSAMKGCSCHPSALAITALRAASLPGLKPVLPLSSNHSYSPGRCQQTLTARKLCCSLLQEWLLLTLLVLRSLVLGFGVGNPSQAAVGRTQKRTAMHWWKALQIYLPCSLLDSTDNISDSPPQTVSLGRLVLNCFNRGD